jgi:hypothetical protein
MRDITTDPPAPETKVSQISVANSDSASSPPADTLHDHSSSGTMRKKARRHGGQSNLHDNLSGLLTRHNSRLLKLILLVLVFITALYTKEYRGEYQLIVNNHVGGAFYVLFGSLAFSLLFSHMRPVTATLLALGITSILEVIQWFRFPALLDLTKMKVFAYILGNSFNPYDFIYYIIGAGVGFVALMLTSEKLKTKN